MQTDHQRPPGSGFRIDPVVDDDIGILYEFIERFAEFQGIKARIDATPQLLREHLLGDRRHAEGLILRLNDEAVGYCIYYYTFSSFLAKPVLFIEDIYLESHARGQGHGRSVLSHLRARARQYRCGRLEWAVQTEQRRAMEFYESLGSSRVPGVVLFRWAVAP